MSKAHSTRGRASVTPTKRAAENSLTSSKPREYRITALDNKFQGVQGEYGPLSMTAVYRVLSAIRKGTSAEELKDELSSSRTRCYDGVDFIPSLIEPDGTQKKIRIASVDGERGGEFRHTENFWYSTWYETRFYGEVQHWAVILSEPFVASRVRGIREYMNMGHTGIISEYEYVSRSGAVVPFECVRGDDYCFDVDSCELEFFYGDASISALGIDEYDSLRSIREQLKQLSESRPPRERSV